MPKSKGKRNPPPQLTVYPGFGFRVSELANSNWILRLEGVVYQIPIEFSVRKRMMLRMLRQVMKVPAEALESDLFRQRVSPFLANAQQGRRITITLGDRVFDLSKPTRRNGRFAAALNVPAGLVAELVENGVPRIGIEVATDGPDPLTTRGEVYLHGTRGLSVISDIDDTIKHSVVTDRQELLANTFLREFQCVPGMRDLYQDWAAQGISFHYVSSSPWQLFESLRELQSDAGFPLGALHLRNFRLRDQFLKRVKIVRRPGKARSVHTVISSLPKQKFILIGDSGEKDPDIYARACREFPDQIAAVFIRELPERPLVGARLTRLERHLSIPFQIYHTAGQLRELAAPVIESCLAANL